MNGFKLTEMKTSIFHVPQTYSLAHAVSADLNTIKGTLAWQFNVIFGQFDELTRQQAISCGNVAVMEHNTRFVYFLVTKDTLYEQTTYDTLHSAMICMREHMRAHEIMKVAMPRICCGKDGLKWPKIKEIMQQVFAREYNVEILICDNDMPSMPSVPKCNIVEVKGNIFGAPKDFSLVHAVSADFALCAGIGLEFKCKFGQVSELVKQNKHTGNVAVLPDGERFIYNLVTKERNHERCTYPALYYALVAMREHMLENNVRKLAVPRLGCGIDRLNWSRVKAVFELVFANDDVEIITYFHDPPELVQRRSKSRSVSNLTGRMSMTLRLLPHHSNSATVTLLTQRTMSSDLKLKFNEVEGDLFSAPESFSLAHCVGADFAMGAGIAVKFKQIYGQVKELLAQGVKTGGVAVLKDKERYIYYLVTKPQSWGSPTYDDLHASLCAMREHMRSNNVHQLAIPRIGCGIDGLEWDKVSAKLTDIFGQEELELTVYNFVPK